MTRSLFVNVAVEELECSIAFFGELGSPFAERLAVIPPRA